MTPLPDREAVHAAALTLVTTNPELRSKFAEKFSAMIRTHDLELFEYCMFELRWPEVQAELEAAARIADDFRVRDVLNKALDAFTDRWSGRGFYARFSE